MGKAEYTSRFGRCLFLSNSFRKLRSKSDRARITAATPIEFAAFRVSLKIGRVTNAMGLWSIYFFNAASIFFETAAVVAAAFSSGSPAGVPGRR